MTIDRWMNLGIMVGTVMVPAFAIIGMAYHLLKNKIKIRRYNLHPSGFTDRYTSIDELSEHINKNSQIINIYGKRGIGKSALLKFYCDLVNGKIDKENIAHEKYDKPKNAKALYIELSGYNNRERLVEQISEQLTDDSSLSLSQTAKRIKSYLFRHKRIIIVLDNINNAGLEKEIESIINTFATISRRFVFVVGSIEKLALLNLINFNINQVLLPVFKEDDIFKFARKNSNDKTQIDQYHLSKILEVSKGLPIFVNLFLKDHELSFGSNFRVQKYVKNIVENLSSPAFDLAQFISLLSITKATVSTGDICMVSGLSTDSLSELENNALIEYDRTQNAVKMHELYRDYINTEYVELNQQKIETIYEAINSDRLLERAYYLLLLHSKEEREDCLIAAINDAVDNENYSFLLLLGEHFKLMYNFEPGRARLNSDTFITIIWGYLQGLLGVGNYPAAQEIVDSCKLVVRDTVNILEFELSLLIANLYHLQIQYAMSINTYQTLLMYCDRNEFNPYQSKCLQGIAHAYRHEGKYPIVAIEYYNKAIAAADALNQKSISLACKQELLTLHNALGQMAEAEELYSELELGINSLPADQYMLSQISYRKVKARYLRFQRCLGFDAEELKLLKQVLADYSAMKKRLQYNTYFELGEYDRLHENYAAAIKNYNTALIFSRRNLDYNLESMCIFGIILCEITSKKPLHHENSQNQMQVLAEILNKCKDHGLFYNKLMAELLLAKVSNTEAEKSILIALKTIGYQKEAAIAETDTFQDILLTLM